MPTELATRPTVPGLSLPCPEQPPQSSLAALDGVEQERTTPESRILLYKRVQRRHGSITLSTALSLNEHLSRLTSVENSIVIVIDTYKVFYLCIFQLMIFMAGLTGTITINLHSHLQPCPI